MTRLMILAALLASGCAPAAVAPARPAADMTSATWMAPAFVPTGATMSPSGFATVLDAPPDPAMVAAARMPANSSADRRGWYAKEHGLTEAEARKRLSDQARLRPAFVALMKRLRKAEPGNYVDAMLRHEPDWGYVLFFKRAPQATLAKYTKEPRFVAASARYSQDDRKRLIEPWRVRWSGEGIPFGYGLDAVYPDMKVQMGISAADYRTLAAERGWATPPPPILLDFTDPPVRPAVDPRVAHLVRGFATERYATLMQLEALGVGTLVLDDGCLRLKSDKGRGATVVFHHETGIGVDAAGYLALIDRMTGKVRARVGEKLAWGAPNAIPEKGMVGLEALRAACPGELVNIGNPDSYAVFQARYPHVGRAESPPPPPPPPSRRD